MKTRILTVTVGIAVTLSLGSRADVNMREGSFVETAIDLQLPTENGPLELKRAYSSRSLHQGLFGKGWCTELERSLSRIDDERVAVSDCRFGSEIVYSNKESMGGSKLRKPAAVDRTQYVASQRPGEIVTLQNGVFTLKSQDGSTLRFDRKGRLVYLKNAKGLLMQIERDDLGLPKGVKTPGSKIGIRFVIDRMTHLVSQVKSSGTSSGPSSVRYQYQQGLLVQGGTAKYKYDDDSNLTTISKLGGEQKISYDSGRDWVVRVRQKTCIEEYQYSKFTDDWFRSTLQRKCEGQPPQQISYDFHQKVRADGRRGLEKVIIKTAQKTVTLEWDANAKLKQETTGVVNVLE